MASIVGSSGLGASWGWDRRGAMGRKFGLSFSWKRAVDISAARGKIARSIGIPTTRSGQERKLGRLILKLFGLK